MVGFFIGATFFYYKKTKSAEKQAVEKNGNWEEVKKSYAGSLQNHLTSTVGEAWKKKDFETLMSSFGEEKKARLNRDFFQASIYVLDVGPPQFSEEEQAGLNKLKKKIVSYILEESISAVGEQMQARSYAAKTLIKLGSLPKPEVEELEAYFKKSSPNPRREIVLDILLAEKTLRPVVTSYLSKQLESSNAVGEALVLLSFLRDQDARKRLINIVFKFYSNYSSAVRPSVLKFLALNHKTVDGDFKTLIKQASKEKSEIWKDSFLVAVKELDAVASYREEIVKIKNDSSYPQLQMVAESLLSSHEAAR
jgi:hypothetical protein